MADPPTKVRVTDDDVKKSRWNSSGAPDEHRVTTYRKNPGDHWQTPLPTTLYAAPTGGAERKVERSDDDNGDLPDDSVASPDHKKHRVDSPETQKQQPISRCLWKEHKKKCCNCTQFSTCQTSSCCQCFAQDTECVSC